MKKIEQVVIRIANDYTPKNQLQKLIVENLKPLQHGFVPDIETARYLIKDAVEISHVQCKTRCQPQKLNKHPSHYSIGIDKDWKEVYSVSGLITVEIMKLQKL